MASSSGTTDDGIVRIGIIAPPMRAARLVRALQAVPTGERSRREIGRISPDDLYEEEEPFDLLVWWDPEPPPLDVPSDLLVIIDRSVPVATIARDHEGAVSILGEERLETTLPLAVGAIEAGLRVIDLDLERGEPRAVGSDDRLSPAERAVYTELSAGYSNQEIAERLGLSVNTIKYHLAGIFEKLNVENRTQAALRSRFR